MVEYTRQLLNSKCDLAVFNKYLNRIVEEIIRFVIEKRRNQNYAKYDLNNFTEKNKKLKYVLKPINNWCPNVHLYGSEDHDLLLKELIRQIINTLKETFIDSNIYNEIKETNDIYDNITFHNLIIVDWS